MALLLGRSRPFALGASGQRHTIPKTASRMGMPHHRLRRLNIAPRSLVDGIIHIQESWILIGSAAVSLALPAFAGRLRGSKVEKILPSEAMMMLSTDIRLVDIRTRAQIRRQGVPLSVKESSTFYNSDSIVFHAPKYVMEGGRLRPNVNFEDEVLFASQVHADTSFVILDANGTVGEKAAARIAKLGNRHDIYVVKGGFEAWKAAGLPSEGLPQEDERHYFCETLTRMHGDSSASLGSMSVLGSMSGHSANEVMLDSSSRSGAPIFRPKILDVLAKGYTADNFKQDVFAGMTIGIVALSLSMALGIASESTPAIGLYTAVVAGFLISALGGSLVTVGGPTAAFIPIVVGISHNFGPDKLIASTALAGLMLVAMGATGLGSLVKFVPRPVVTGFTAGIATYIFSTQIKDFLGMGVPGHLAPDVPVPSEFLEKVLYLGTNIPLTHGPSLALAAASFAFIKFYPAPFAKLVPPQIAAVVLGTTTLFLLDGPLDLHTQIETIGSHFGADAIPNHLPMPSVPSGLTLESIPELLQPSFTIALLAAIESLLCARVADTMVGDRHNPNTELIAQGMANVASAAFGALPVTGALARTAANVRAGGRTPVSGMVHAVTILAVILVAAPLALYVPLPCLSAVLVVVAINMGEWKNFTLLPGWPEKDAQLFLVAFTLTLLQDVAVAVEVGMAAALLLFVSDVTSSIHVRAVPPGRTLPQLGTFSPAALLPPPSPAAAAAQYSSSSSNNGNGNGNGSSAAEPTMAGFAAAVAAASHPAPLRVPHHAAYLEVTGSLLFGAGDMLEDALEEMQKQEPVKVVLLDMSHVSVMDVSGLEVMEEQAKRMHLAGKQIVLCGLCRQPLRMLSKAGFLDEVGRANVCRSLEQALARTARLAEMEASGTGGNGSNGSKGAVEGAGGKTPVGSHAA